VDHPQDEQSYIDVEQLIASTKLSRATIWRLKKADQIPFIQPGGKGSRVLFPKNAIEQAKQGESMASAKNGLGRPEERIPGSGPEWKKKQKRNHQQ
jgi:predicted DNA-binding transcriptional regulator AlpA